MSGLDSVTRRGQTAPSWLAAFCEAAEKWSPGCADFDSDATEGYGIPLADLHGVLHIRGTSQGERFWVKIPVAEEFSRLAPTSRLVSHLVGSIGQSLEAGRASRSAAAS